MVNDFQTLFPDKVEKYQIKYPIIDELVKAMPVLHKGDPLPPKPTPFKINLSGVTFERLLVVWEFFNTFLFLVPEKFDFQTLHMALVW